MKLLLCLVFFTEQIFKKSLRQKTQTSISFKTRSRFFKTLVRWAFEALGENQKLDREFEKFGQEFQQLVRVIQKSDHVFVFNTAHDVPISHG